MAIASFTEFYLTQGSGAWTYNGGGPLGTNDGPVYISTTVASDSAGTVLTDSAASPWSGCSVGDWVSFTDGAGTYEIARIQSISGADATVSPAYSAGLRSLSGKTARVGGAWNTFGTALTLLDNLNGRGYPSSVDPPRLNVKRHGGNNYDVLTTASLSNNWLPNRPLVIEGYNSTPGDIDPWTSENRAHLLCDGTAYVNINAAWVTLVSIAIEASSSATYCLYFGSNGDYCTALNCRAVQGGTGTTANAIMLLGSNCTAIRCLAELPNGAASGSPSCIRVYHYAAVIGCRCIGAGTSVGDGMGIYVAGYAPSIVDSVARNCEYGLFLSSHSARVIGCDLVGNKYGLRAQSQYYLADATIINCKIAHSAQYGLYSAASYDAYCPGLAFNEYYANTAGNHSARILTLHDAHEQTAGGEPVRDYANDDWRPAWNSAGREAGFPGILPGGGDGLTGHRDIGALQPRRLKRRPVFGPEDLQCR